MVMLKRTSLIFACLAMLFLTVGARADGWDRRTTLTFNESVSLPGIVLPAGTYVFKLVNTPGLMNTVEVLNAEENKVLTTIIAIPTEHLSARDKTFIGFEERGAGLPEAIHEWMYPGDRSGLEFVYR
jgi:hypothetical protein